MADSAARGEDLFARRCTGCHGESGHGDGPAARLLQPAPADLTRATYQHGQSDKQVAATIAKGVPQTSMAAWSGTFSSNDIDDLVQYLATLRRHP